MPPQRAAEIDRKRAAWYDGNRRTLLHIPRKGDAMALSGKAAKSHPEAVSPPFAPLRKLQHGGRWYVDVEKTGFRRIAFPGVFHHGGADTYHKSVLAARSAPERLTVR